MYWIRSFHGYNNNPDVICFQSAYRKLACNTQIQPPSQSNCRSLQMELTTQSVYTDIYFVSSRRRNKFQGADPKFLDDVAKEREKICADVANLEEIDRTLYLMDGFLGASISYIAFRIEEKIENCYHCDLCKSIFNENDKVLNCYKSSTAIRSPCRSTYDICAKTDKYLRTHKWNDRSEFKVKYFLIFQDLEYEKLYAKSSFEDHEEHKFHLIKSIINEYSRIRGNQLAKTATTDEMQIILRKRLNKLVLSKGQ